MLVLRRKEVQAADDDVAGPVGKLNIDHRQALTIPAWPATRDHRQAAEPWLRSNSTLLKVLRQNPSNFR
jgi:hypothetical protein